MQKEYDENKDYKIEELIDTVLTEHLKVTDEAVKKQMEKGFIFSFLQ